MMRLNDITKGLLVCVCLIVLMAISGTVDYHDRMHFCESPHEDTFEGVVHASDSAESAYDLMRIVSDSELIPQ